MRREKQDDVEQQPTSDETALISIDTNEPLPDWRELGRRVLNESMRRSAKDMRRRNAGGGFAGRLRIVPGGRA